MSRRRTSRTVNHAIHLRWIERLLNNPPEGVPLEERAWIERPRFWPATFGNMVEGKPVHLLSEGEGYCFQCLHCRYYITLESMLGADWGACTLPGGQYDGQTVFEHWTCASWKSE